MHRSRLTAAAAVAAMIACATNPATGKKQLMLVSEAQEIAMGKEADQQAVAAYGLYADPKVQAYVERLGKGLAAKSERPEPALELQGRRRSRGQRVRPARRVHLRHARHHGAPALRGRAGGGSRARDRPRDRPPLGEPDEQAAARAWAASIVGMAVVPELQRFGGLAQQGLGLLFLKFGRDDENAGRRAGPALHDARGLRPARDGRGIRRPRRA